MANSAKNKVQEFIEAVGVFTEVWRMTYSEFISAGMNATESLAHTQGFMTAFMTAAFGSASSSSKED